MGYVSTRDAEGARPASLSEAIHRGLAPDGGLYVPTKLPRLTVSDFDGADDPAQIAAVLLAPFFDGDPLAGELDAICAETFIFPLPVIDLDGGPSVLELFHGPTAAFKDVGAGFLAACTQRLDADTADPLTILVATSGDTGSAVAAAFHHRPGIEVVILFPAGLVSERQAHLLSCWDGNVRTFAVDGAFDDCQRMVKAAFADTDITSARRLSSANSINIGRLLPQMVYYAMASLRAARQGLPAPGFIIPSGNLGNAFACLLAREIGLPIGDVMLATNANLTLAEFMDGGEWAPRPSVPTLASAMDVGDPSNMERIFWRFRDHAGVRGACAAAAVDDEAIRETIREGPRRWHQVWCPHTATAVRVWEQLPAAVQARGWVLVATAHPAKFNDIVEPLVGQPVPVPAEMQRLLELPARAEHIGPDPQEFRARLVEA
jgi:threonine synthase